MAGVKKLREDEDEVDLDQLEPVDDLEVEVDEDEEENDTGTDKTDTSDDADTDTDSTDEGTDVEIDEETEEEREAIRERRRQERKERKEFHRQKEEQARREMAMIRRERDEMRERLAVLERKSTGAELAQVDSAIEETQRVADLLKQQIRVATEANDGVALAEATDRFYQVKRREEDLTRLRQAATQNTAQREQRSPIDPTLRRHAESWMSKNTWYNPQGTDPDSRVALTIDNAMAEEGWDPRTPEFWDELSERLTRYLPHRMKATQKAPAQSQQREKPRATTSGSGRDGTGSGTAATTFKVSPARVQAMKDAGIWDDLEARNKMIKSFRQYDKDNATN